MLFIMIKIFFHKISTNLTSKALPDFDKIVHFPATTSSSKKKSIMILDYFSLSEIIFSHRVFPLDIK